MNIFNWKLYLNRAIMIFSKLLILFSDLSSCDHIREYFLNNSSCWKIAAVLLLCIRSLMCNIFKYNV